MTLRYLHQAQAQTNTWIVEMLKRLNHTFNCLPTSASLTSSLSESTLFPLLSYLSLIYMLYFALDNLASEN